MGQTVSTRLLDLNMLKLCEFPIDQIPPYQAVSHVWSKGLFAASDRHRLEDCAGLKMIQSLLERRPELSHLEHCWVDTRSISQDDAEDKTRQVPKNV
jgi:hypothetical protein